MSLYRLKRNGKPIGTWFVEWERKRVGKIRLATGEKERRKAEHFETMLDTLADAGRWDTLLALKAKTLTIRDLYHAWKKGDLASLPGAETMQRIDALAPEWVKGTRNKHTKKNRAGYIRRLLKMKVDATLADLPEILKLLRRRMVEKPRSFNEIHNSSRALIRDHLGERHALYLDVADIRSLPYRAEGREPWKPAQMRERMDWMGEMRGRMLWELTLTGMRPNEYWRDPYHPAEPWRGNWQQEFKLSLIRVHGTKTEGADRIVPLVEPLQGPTCSYLAFKSQLARFPGGGDICYRARHTFRHLLERTRIPPSRQDIYMGHALKGVRGTYLWHEVRDFVAADADEIRAVFRDYRLSVFKEAVA